MRAAEQRMAKQSEKAGSLMLGLWERQAMIYIPALLGGISASQINDIASTATALALSGIIGAALTYGALLFFHYRGWKRTYAYVAALFLFVGLALPAIILATDRLQPYSVWLFRTLVRT